MKKYLSAFLSIIILLGLISCTQNTVNEPATEEKSSVEECISDEAELTVSEEETQESEAAEETTAQEPKSTEAEKTANEGADLPSTEKISSETPVITGSTAPSTTEEEGLPDNTDFTETGPSTEADNTLYEKSTSAHKEELTSAQCEESTAAFLQKEETTEIHTTDAPDESSEEEASATKEQDEAKKSFCTLTISCRTLLNNTDSLTDAKKGFVPANGVILENTKVIIEENDTVFDIIKRACKENVCSDSCKYCTAGAIQFEYTYTPAFGNYYIEGIHQLYEKDAGALSGWMYSVNGVFPNKGISTYEVSENDSIAVLFTCDMGEDIENSF